MMAGDVLVEECSWTGTNTGNIATPDGNTIPPTGNSVNPEKRADLGIPGRQDQVCKKLLGHDDNDVPIRISRLSSNNYSQLPSHRKPGGLPPGFFKKR